VSLFKRSETTSDEQGLGAGFFEGGFEILTLGDANESVDNTVVVFDYQRWQRPNLVLVGDVLLFINVDLGELDVLVVGFEIVEDRILGLARATPVCVKVCESNRHLYSRLSVAEVAA